tara:strand:+ start:266 stop:511 length:246 start_codon:yes stop_codon:yes gene_type:complete
MEHVKTLKGVNDRTWKKFKHIAARNKVNMGALFEKMVSTFDEREEAAWNAILETEPIFTTKEAETAKKEILAMRREWGFRQ